MKPFGSHLVAGERVVVLGVPGTGKTTIVRELTADAPRCVWYDRALDYEAPDRLCLTMAELRDNPLLLGSDLVRIAVSPTDDQDEREEAADLDWLCKTVRKVGPIVLAMDELGDLRPFADRCLGTLFRKCRKELVVPIAASQFATDLPVRVRKAATRAIITAQTHPTELAEVERTYGLDVRESVERWEPFNRTVWRTDQWRTEPQRRTGRASMAG